MKLVKKIQVPRQYVFDKIIESSLYDIKQQTGKTVKVSDLENFEYTKNFGQTGSGTIKFDKVRENEIYAFSTETNRNSFHTHWELQEINDSSTEVIITETRTSKGGIQLLNDMLMGFLLAHTKKKQMSQMLETLESGYK